jgi:hypothetical protein
MLPLFFIRDICGIIVNIFKIFGLSLNVFVFIEPFIDFQRKSLELQKIRVSGCSFAFSADPADAYMRWLNLKLVDLLTMGLYEKIFEKKARKAYLGFLDSQIRWDVDPKEIPIGFDTKRNFVYFSSVVPSLETTILELIYLLPMVLLPWPSLFAKHRLTASWQLTLSKYRFGGRQPRLGGDFVGEKNCACNDAGFKKACKLNTKALCLALDIGPCGKAYEVALENSIEWVVPPPKKACRFTYHLCPFPCGGHDEEALSIDVAIPIVVDDLELYDFKLPKKCDANAIKRSEIETILEKWVKKAPKPLRAQRTKSLARYGTTKDIIQRYTGGARTTLTVNELQDAIEMLNVVAKDGRVSSPVFRRHRASSAGSLIDGEAMVRYRQNSIDMRREPGEITPKSRSSLGMKSANPLFDPRKKAQAKEVRNEQQHIPRTLTMDVQVPPGVGPGGAFNIDIGRGKLKRVVVPAGVSSGQTIRVRYPAPIVQETERPEEGAIAAREREADIKSKSTESTAKSAEVAEAVKAAADVAKAAEAAAAKSAKTSSAASGTAAESAVADRKDHEAIATVGETTSEGSAGGASCLPNISLVAELNPHSAFSFYSHLFCLLSL